MKSSISKVFAGLCALACGCDVIRDWPDGPYSGGPPHSDPSIARVQTVWNDAAARGLSAVALVRHRGEVLGRFAAGQSRRDAGLPNTPETAFDIGSITKQFTAAAITQLYERGELDLAAPLGSFFEGIPAEKAAITVHQLLTHTAGFPGAVGLDDEAILRGDYLQRAWDWPLAADPGALFWYSNTGYSILGAILERRTGRAYDDYLRDALLGPAGLHDTGYQGLDIDPARVAVGYFEDESDDPLQRPHADDGYYWNLRANGGTLSTLADLARWSDALLGGDVLGPEALERYLTPHVREGLGEHFSYAYGWEISDTEAGRLVSHTGGNGFFFATVRQYVDADLLVIVLSNEATDDAFNLQFDLAHAVLPELPSAADRPEPEPYPLEHFEDLAESSETFAESLDFTADHDRAVAMFFAYLDSGSARFRLLAPDGQLFAESEASPGVLLERALVVPRRLGPWRFEVDADAATGPIDFGWAWDD